MPDKRNNNSFLPLVRDEVFDHSSQISRLRADLGTTSDKRVTAFRQSLAQHPTQVSIPVTSAGTTATTYSIMFQHHHIEDSRQFHVWFRPNLTTAWNRVGTTQQSPASITITAPPTHGQFAVQTEYENGFLAPLEDCPIVVF